MERGEEATADAASRKDGNPGSRKAIAAEQTRADILRVAVREFAEKGLAGARVDEIAQGTATSKHMIYYHFGNKIGLYRAVLEYAYSSLLFAEQSIDYDELDPEDALAALVGRSFDAHLGHPEYVRIIMNENLGQGANIDQVQGLERRRDILHIMRGIIRRGADAGILRKDIDVLQLHMTISALCFYYVSNRFTFGHIFEIDLTGKAATAHRRAEIVDSLLRICRA